MNLLLALTLLAFLRVPAAASSSSSDAAAAQQYLRGTLLERRGAFAEALASFEKALEYDPKSAFLAGEAAELALELRDWPRAEKWARRRLELAPKDGRSQLVLARVLWGQGREEEAIAAYARALKLDPSSLDAILSLTELLAPTEPKKARAFLEKFLAGNPDHAARVLHELGKLDAQEGRLAEAEKKLRRAILLDDAESDEVRMTLGTVFEEARSTAAAIAEYRKVLSAQPDDWELWAHIGELEAARGDLEAARAEFRRLKERRPSDPAAAAWLAADAERQGDFKRAAAMLEASSALAGDPTLHLRLGYYRLQAGEPEAAMKVLEAARRRWPKDDRVAYYLALGHDDRGRRDEAIKLLREVLAVKPEDRDARWQLATILEKADRMDEAETEFRRLLEDKEDDAPALNYLGYSLADRGRKLPEAEALIRRALALEPGSPAYRDSLGWALFKQGRSTEALVHLQAAAAALPGDETLWDHVGDARRAAGDDEGAWLAWRLAQSLGAPKAGAKADGLQKGLKDEALGELWRRHLASVHGGLKRMTGLCELKGRIAGKEVSRQALFTFLAPKTISFELLGPMFSTAWRARLDSHGFAMDELPVDGLDGKKVEEAARGAFESIGAALAGEPFAPGPARYRSGWGGPRLERPEWRVELDGALAGSVAPASNGMSVALSDFLRAGVRQAPRLMEAKGRFWSLAISCPEPKGEFE